jgi:NAD(P)-dependent dehydrogenase (short-subunit alcohol dehydrogenase family)
MTYSPLELNGKVAVVVGGTSGIGRAIAHGFARAAPTSLLLLVAPNRSTLPPAKSKSLVDAHYASLRRR